MRKFKVFHKGKFYTYVKSPTDLDPQDGFEVREIDAPEFDVYYPRGDYAPEVLTNISIGAISIYKDHRSGLYGVNWSACGTVPTEHARVYAQAILKAAEIADELNKKQN